MRNIRAIALIASDAIVAFRRCFLSTVLEIISSFVRPFWRSSIAIRRRDNSGDASQNVSQKAERTPGNHFMFPDMPLLREVVAAIILPFPFRGTRLDIVRDSESTDGTILN
jgi:hypothetical protein